LRVANPCYLLIPCFRSDEVYLCWSIIFAHLLPRELPVCLVFLGV
jgi:hypothetical protein